MPLLQLSCSQRKGSKWCSVPEQKAEVMEKVCKNRDLFERSDADDLTFEDDILMYY